MLRTPLVAMATTLTSILLAAALLEAAPNTTKVYLPASWSRLQLTAEQKKAINAVQLRHLEEINKIRAKERKELFTFLTADQKAKLKSLLEDQMPPANEPAGK